MRLCELFYVLFKINMFARALTKCLSVFFVIFFMCPKRTHLSVPIGNQQEYYHAVRRSSNMKFSDHIPPVMRNHEKNTEKDCVEANKPFDLTDEEIEQFKLWDKGVVPYYIDVLSFADKVLRDRIRWFLNLVNTLTSINFVELPRPPKDDETRWVFFVNRRGRLGCADHSVKNFTLKGVQAVALGYDCMNTGRELAEAVLSIAGVPAQHNSPDRDDYIEVLDDNIIREKSYLFEKLDEDEWLFKDISYDFASAGHFHPHKHSVNGRATIKTKKTFPEGTHKSTGGFSTKDIRKINMLYDMIKTKKDKNDVLCSQLFEAGNKKSRGNKEKKIHKNKNKATKEASSDESNDEANSGTNDVNGDIERSKNRLKRGGTKDFDLPDIHFKPGQSFGRNQRPDILSNETQLLKPFYKDPLTYLSDYETGDDNYQRSVAKKANAYSNFIKLAEFWKKNGK